LALTKIESLGWVYSKSELSFQPTKFSGKYNLVGLQRETPEPHHSQDSPICLFQNELW